MADIHWTLATWLTNNCEVGIVIIPIMQMKDNNSVGYQYFNWFQGS